jgi:hypothetical protein
LAFSPVAPTPSVLLRPEALRLERANPTHLIGRADDIA